MKIRIATYLAIVAVALIILITVLKEPGTTLEMVYRTAGLFAFLFLFLVILSSEYMPQMKKIFGMKFIDVHHNLARIGIFLMLVHPFAFALRVQSLSVFVPKFYPLMDFFILAGRPALYMVLLAATIALYRKKMIKRWKTTHYSMYPAFLLIFTHSWLIGTDLQSGILQILWPIMILIVFGIFVHKHIIKR